MRILRWFRAATVSINELFQHSDALVEAVGCPMRTGRITLMVPRPCFLAERQHWRLTKVFLATEFAFIYIFLDRLSYALLSI